MQIHLVWSKYSNPAVERQGNAATRFPETGLKQTLPRMGSWLRKGDYKAVLVPKPYGDGEWRLYNVVKDPGETNNLAMEQPDLLKELQQAWDRYADEVGVVLSD